MHAARCRSWVGRRRQFEGSRSRVRGQKYGRLDEVTTEGDSCCPGDWETVAVVDAKRDSEAWGHTGEMAGV